MEGFSKFTPEQDRRIIALSHAVQSGVKFDHETGGDGGDAKHLRTGVNIALSETAALGKLMVDKGLITADEYADAIIATLEREVASYEAMLSKRLGTKVTLS
jgi:hypothetical protein